MLLHLAGMRSAAALAASGGAAEPIRYGGLAPRFPELVRATNHSLSAVFEAWTPSLFSELVDRFQYATASEQTTE